MRGEEASELPGSGGAEMAAQVRLGAMREGPRRSGAHVEDLADVLVGEILVVMEEKNLALGLRQESHGERQQPVILLLDHLGGDGARPRPENPFSGLQGPVVGSLQMLAFPDPVTADIERNGEKPGSRGRLSPIGGDAI